MTADEFVERYQRLPVAFLLATSGGIIREVNGSCAELLETPPDALRGKSIEALVSDDPRKVQRHLFLWSGSRDFLPGALQFRVNGNEIDVRINGARVGDGSQVLLHLTPRAETHRRFVALNEKIEELAFEIEERRRTEGLIMAQNEVLGIIAKDQPLGEVLERVAGLPKRSGSPEIRISILLAEGQGMRTAAGPGFHDEWHRALEQTLSANLASFGHAPVLIRDMDAAPAWEPLQEAARPEGVRCCWLFPVLSGAGELLGVVVLCGRTPGNPGERELRVARIATGTAAIAIERHRGKERLAGILKRQSAMLDGLPARIALIDAGGRIRSVNLAWLAWMRDAGLPADRFGPGAELLPPHEEIFSPPAGGAVRSVIDGTAATFDGECRWQERDHTRWVRLTVAPVTGGSVIPRDVIVMHLDITDRKLAEDHLLSQAAELTRANAELQQFAYVASHDLREPLRTVKSFSQLLVRRFESVAGADAEEFLRYITDGVTRMEDLIDDLLLYSRVIHGEREEHRGPVDLSDAIAAAIRNLDAAIADNDARICVGELPVVVGDRMQLTQLFQNLIGNAIKYRSSDRPLIEIGSRLEPGGPVVTVADNGIGIASQYHDSIFGLFKRLHARDVPGTGIGLALCRKIAEAHGGSVWVESEPGRGSVFHVLLPNQAGQASTSFK